MCRGRGRRRTDAFRHRLRVSGAPGVTVSSCVPGNKKWLARLVVAACIIDALDRRDFVGPCIDGAKRRELEKGRALLRKSRPGA